MERPDFFELKNGEKVKLPFTDKEYNDRVSKLRSVMDQNGLNTVSYTHLRAHETKANLVCRLLLEKKN